MLLCGTVYYMRKIHLDPKAMVAILTSILFFGTGFLAGNLVGENTYSIKGLDTSPDGANLETVWEAWAVLEDKFVPATTSDKTTTEDHIWGIIEGLARSYNDPYTVFFPPRESKQFEEEISGSFGGIGIEIGIRDDILTVIAPLKDTPADRAGLRAKDYILEINGTSTQNMDIDEAIELLRGEAGTEVVLTIGREGEQEFLTIPIVRDIIEIPTLETEKRSDGIFVISLYNFGGTAIEEMRGALREFVDSGSTKLIIDLRDNPGGYLEAAVEISSWFIPLGDVIVTEDYGTSRESIVHRSKGYDIMEDDWDIVILINEGSASASEIVAGALKEHGKAILIGENTYGKGSVQELVELSHGTSIKVTVARWLTPLGNTISDVGLSPDQTVPITKEDIEADRDPQMDTAVQFLLQSQ